MAITALVNSSPEALDTLNELAAALDNNPNFATDIINALALKAPLASPALTGTPTAPTAEVSTNNTQIATTAFVRAAITALVNSSPEALDTLNELATALGDDPNFATTVTAALALKAPLASILGFMALGLTNMDSTTDSEWKPDRGRWGDIYMRRINRYRVRQWLMRLITYTAFRPAAYRASATRQPLRRGMPSRAAGTMGTTGQ